MRDIPVDVLASFFENLEVSDLERVIESDGALMQPVLWALRRNLGRKLFSITRDFFRKDMNTSSFMAQWSKDNFLRDEFDGIDITKNIFEKFGNNIKKLHVTSGLNSTEISELNQLIQDKCAKHLVHFGFSVSSDEVLEDLIPFAYPNVKHVAILWSNLMNGNSTIDLNEKFPSMKALELKQVTTRWVRSNFQIDIAPLQIFDNHFPHLERFYLELIPSTDAMIVTHIGVNSDVERILEKNPNIKSVAVSGFEMHFLPILHSNLRNLETLEFGRRLPADFFINPNNANNAEIFETVKRFALDMAFYRHMINSPKSIAIRFPHLEELTLSTIDAKLSNQWCEFIETNRELTKLTIQFITNYDSRQRPEYAYLADLNLPLLKEIELERINATVSDEMDNFFDKIQAGQLPGLERIVFSDISKTHTEAVRQKLPSTLKMTRLENVESNDSFDVVITKD